MPWLFKFKKKSAVWWVGYRLHGRQFLRSTGHVDRKLAEQELHRVNAMVSAHKANALTRDLFQHLTGKASPSMTLRAALDDWLREAKGAAGERTVEKYTGLSSDLVSFFKANDRGPMVDEITREDLQRYLSERRSEVSASTANMARKCLAIFFKRCKVPLGVIQNNPVEGIPLFKESRDEKRARRPFTMAELCELYRQAPDDFWRYMVLGGFFTGLRMGDLVTMPIGAADLTAGTIHIKTRKTGATLQIPIAPPLHELLSKRRLERNGASPGEPFWPEQAARYEKSGSGWFSQRFYDLLLTKAGLAKVRPHRSGGKSRADRRNVNETSFHCFRHAYVSTLAALGQNQQIVKALAGHSSDEVNDLYTKVPLDALKRAVALLPDITK